VSEVSSATSGRFGFRTDFPSMCAILNRHAAADKALIVAWGSKMETLRVPSATQRRKMGIPNNIVYGLPDAVIVMH
jgi:hypothetical protein